MPLDCGKAGSFRDSPNKNLAWRVGGCRIIGMKRRAFRIWIMAGVMAGTAAGEGEEGVRLTLGTESIRAPLEQAAPAFERWPDVRLKLEASPKVPLSVLDPEPRVRGIEVRLPTSY